ncbi:MAG: cupin domain-containing protein [Fusobacterium sp. JB021]|nr:cupin domain-containing protein [Fusobacterium sp. JB020]MDP0494214.1 cupin domain-containing protein [Fusobacterium sp. JB021]MDP0505699.1 cupin domain-containing protein [Fusobacterium sp. JB019]
MGLVKNLEKGKAFEINNLIKYSEGKVASLNLVQKSGLNLTVISFDKGEGLSAHTASGDAIALILEGEAKITIDGVVNIVREGEGILMPAGLPHSLKALTKFKMWLTVVKE